MSALLLVDSHFGNITRLAEVVAQGAGPDASAIGARLRGAVDARKVA